MGRCRVGELGRLVVIPQSLAIYHERMYAILLLLQCCPVLQRSSVTSFVLVLLDWQLSASQADSGRVGIIFYPHNTHKHSSRLLHFNISIIVSVYLSETALEFAALMCQTQASAHSIAPSYTSIEGYNKSATFPVIPLKINNKIRGCNFPVHIVISLNY